MISHSRNSSDSSGYHEASVLSDNPDSAGRLPETLPRRNKVPLEMPRKLAQTSQSSKSLSNLTSVPGTLSHGISSTSLSSTGLSYVIYIYYVTYRSFLCYIKRRFPLFNFIVLLVVVSLIVNLVCKCF